MLTSQVFWSVRLDIFHNMDVRACIQNILDTGHLMSLATTDEGGLWVADVIFIHDENLNLYWMSDPEVRHSRALLQNPHIAGTITVSNTSKEPNLGIQFVGTAEKIDGPRHDLAVKHLNKRGYPAPREDEDVLDGDSWYVVRLNTIDLIDEENLGYEKETLRIK